MYIPLRSTVYDEDAVYGDEFYDDQDDTVLLWDMESYGIVRMTVGEAFDRADDDIMNATAFEGSNGDTLCLKYEKFQDLCQVHGLMRATAYTLEWGRYSFEWCDWKGRATLKLNGSRIIVCHGAGVMSKGFPPEFHYVFRFGGMLLFKWKANNTVFTCGIGKGVVGGFVENDEYRTNYRGDKVGGTVAKARLLYGW